MHEMPTLELLLENSLKDFIKFCFSTLFRYTFKKRKECSELFFTKKLGRNSEDKVMSKKARMEDSAVLLGIRLNRFAPSKTAFVLPKRREQSCYQPKHVLFALWHLFF